MAIEIMVSRVGNRLVPAYDSDSEAIKSLKSDEVVSCKITRPRNLEHHRKFFALMNLCFNNQDKYDSPEVLRKVLTLKAGYYDEVVTDKGVVYLPKSISFSKMDQSEFQVFYGRFLDVVCKEIGVFQGEIENELMDFM